MIVLVDIGNTRTKYCLVEHGERSSPKALSNESLGSKFLTEQFYSATKVIVASVSHNELTDNIISWCKQNGVDFERVESEANKNRVVTAYQQPRQLGIDRWLALVGAAEFMPNKNLLIIDAGTATTYDLIAANGQHQGGWILAGVNMLITTVLANTKQVHANDQEKEQLVFGTNTSENVHNAAWAATVGAVELAISQSSHQGVLIDEIILTGGNAHILSSLMTQKNVVIEDLVFIGLQAYIEN